MTKRLLPFVLLVLLVLAVISHASTLFVGLWFVLGIYLLSRLWSWRVSRQVRIQRHCDDRVVAGDELLVTLQVTNAGLVPVPYLELRDHVSARLTTTYPPEYVLSLGARRETRIVYRIACQSRGYHAIGPLQTRTGDPLGLDRRELPPVAERRIVVYPRIVPLRRLGLPTRSAVTAIPARASLLKDPSRIIGIRDYRPGDALHAVHWGATAHTGQLMVKQYEPAVSRATVLCLDLDPGAYPVGGRNSMEQAIVVAASLAHHIVTREELPVGLATAGTGPLAAASGRMTLPPHKRREHLTAILEVLAVIEPSGEPGFVPLLREECSRWGAGSSVIVITGQLHAELVDTLLFLARRGHAVAVFLVRPKVVRVDEPTIPTRIPVHRVWDDEDLAA